VAVFATLMGLGGSAASFEGSDAPRGAKPPIVTVIRHGGLCSSGAECRSVFRIRDATITAGGYWPRRLRRTERLALLRAIAKLDAAYLHAHRFKGTCPTAYDGRESIYRFRGFKVALASCTYDLRRVRAVQVAEALLAKLKPR
jgi:hypothetical protein